MTVERITLTHVRVPLVEPFRISNGEVREKDGIIVTVMADGLTGHGEASPVSGSFYSPETPESTWEELETKLVPAILGEACGAAETLGPLLITGGRRCPRTSVRNLERRGLIHG